MKPSHGLFAPVAMAAGLIAGPVHGETITDEQLWLNLSAQIGLRPGVLLNVEVQPRLRDDASDPQQLLGRIGLGWQATRRLVLWSGYVHNHLPFDGGPDANEERFYQQANWTVPGTGRDTLVARARLEQRWRSTGSGTGWRFRQQLRWLHPLGKDARGIAAVVSGEIMEELADTDWGARAGFEQSRLLIALNVPLTRHASIEPGYLNQLQNRRGGATALNHVAQVSLLLRY